MKLARAVLLLSALTFAGIGSAFLLAPGTMGSFVGVALIGPSADNDVRAVYGGLQLGCAAFLAYGACHAARFRITLVAQLFLFGGLAAGRVVSWFIVGSPGALGSALHVAEFAGLLGGGVALWHLRSAA